MKGELTVRSGHPYMLLCTEVLCSAVECDLAQTSSSVTQCRDDGRAFGTAEHYMSRCET